jgi:hypothetical protein
MSRIWRTVAPLALAGGLLASGLGAIPAEAASPAAVSVTISATSPNFTDFGTVKDGKVDGYALVVYKAGPKAGNADTAKISGDVTGAESGNVATLLAKPFGAKSFSATSTPLTLTGAGSQTYSFSVTPTLATQYEIQVTTGTAGTAVDVTSAAASVYVTPYPGITHSKTKCSGSACKTSFEFYELLPAAAKSTELAKKWYLYYAVDPKLFSGHFPKYLPLVKSAKMTKSRYSAGYLTFSVSWGYRTTVKNPAKYLIFIPCSKDNVTKDGIGLPGHHGCGASKVLTTAPYTG